MKNDIKSNIKVEEHLTAKSYAAGTYNGTAVDLQGYSNVSFLISCGTVGASGTVDAKIQYSDDNSTWTDATTTQTGEDVDIDQKTAPFEARLHVTKPTARYYRVVLTTGTAASVVGVSQVVGGARHRPVSYA